MKLLFEEDKFFPSCHASCLLALGDGRLLVAYFAGTREGASDVGIWMSEYDGREWRKPRRIIKLNDTAHWNPVLFHTRDGVRLVFKAGSVIQSWRSYTMLSRDGGREWSAPVPYLKNYSGGPVRSKPIRMSNGELLAPNSDEDSLWRPRVDASSDEGENFIYRAPIPISDIPGRGAIQPALWESGEGLIHALLRTGAGEIYRSDSPDYGASWCEAYSTGLPNNNSGIDVVRAADGRLFLSLNPVRRDRGARTPLCVYESSDDGKTFAPFATLADDPLDAKTGARAEFSYPSLEIAEGRLMAAFTYNRRSIAYWEARV